MNAVQPAVGLALLRRLSGFRGYPKEGGEGRFVEVLCEVSISVEHANSVVETFDGEFPALRDIRDVALNLRPKFEPKVDQRTQ